MLTEIEQEAQLTASYTGRSSFTPQVMAAISRVPRHEFVPSSEEKLAYYNSPLPIGHDQTISQPYIVALMTDLLDIESENTVLEIGTGSGYQTAILAEISRKIYSIEIIKTLADKARTHLQELGYSNINIKTDDGYNGWPEAAPFDKIIVTAAIGKVPPALVEQLNHGGRLVLPIGSSGPGASQKLTLIEKDDDGKISTREILPVVFVPLKRYVS